MKVFLDDKRPTPTGWIGVKWPDEVIELLKNKTITHLSLDHDLGDDERGTGYDVLLWLEEQVVLHDSVPPENITVHSANVSARRKMEQAIVSINRFSKRKE